VFSFWFLGFFFKFFFLLVVLFLFGDFWGKKKYFWFQTEKKNLFWSLVQTRARDLASTTTTTLLHSAIHSLQHIQE
jgi:hypothetical protein